MQAVAHIAQADMLSASGCSGGRFILGIKCGKGFFGDSFPVVCNGNQEIAILENERNINPSADLPGVYVV